MRCFVSIILGVLLSAIACSPAALITPNAIAATPEGAEIGTSGVTVWVTGSTRKVLPSDPPEAYNDHWSAAQREVRLRGARGEVVPFQIILTTVQPLTGVDITPGDFVGPGVISADAVTLYRESYYTVASNSDPWGYGLPPAHLPPGPIPDALIPFEDPYVPGRRVGAPFAVPAGRSQPVWVDVAIPPNAAPGDYTAVFTVTVNGTVLTRLTVKLHVWDFALPERPSLIVSIPSDPTWTLPPQYDLPDADLDTVLPLAEKMNQALFAHRLAPGSFFQRPVVTDTTGVVLLDFTAADAEMDPYMAAGLPLFLVPDPWDSYEERYIFRDNQGRFYTAAAFHDPTFVNKAKQYYAALRDHYKARGWFDRAMAFPTDETEWVADEPIHNGPAGFQRLRAWAQLIKSVDPDFRISAADVFPIPPGPPERGWVDLTGLLDDWQVGPDDVDVNPGLFQARQALGETVSYYFNDYGDFIDYKATLHRALAWHAYRQGAYALMGWAAAAWIDDDLNPHSPWTTSFNGVFGHGAGALFWPGYHIEGDPSRNINGPLPSLRLKLAREAVEDADYLALLARRTSDAYARDVARAVVSGDLFHTDLPPDAFYAQRDWIGSLLSGEITVTLTTITGTVTDAVSGVPIAGALVRAAHTAARTADDGRYTLTLAADESQVTVSHPRYHARTMPVTGARLDVALNPVAQDVTWLFSFEAPTEVDRWEFAGVVTYTRVLTRATKGAYALKVVFDDNPADEPEMGSAEFTPTDWRGYTALELDLYNDSPYYTIVEVGIADDRGGWYPQTGGIVTLLPRKQTHVIIPMSEIARDVDLSRVIWLSIAPETMTEEEDYTGEVHMWRLGRRTVYVDAIRLVRISRLQRWLPLIQR